MIEWTPEELAEMAAADAEIEDSFELEDAEKQNSEDLDDFACAQKMGLTVDALHAKRARDRAEYWRNRERHLESSRRWNEEHKSRAKATKAAWYQRNKERILAQQKARRMAMKKEATNGV